MRAQLFSIISLIIITPLLILMFSNIYKTNYYEKILGKNLLNMYRSIIIDLEKSVDISTRRAIIASSDYIVLNNASFENGESVLRELVINGTINGTENLIMVNNTLNIWLKKISSVETIFNVSVNIINISMKDEGFFIKVFAEIDTNINDKTDTIGVKRIEKIEKNVSIENVVDPIYTLNTHGLVIKTIKISKFPYRAKKIAIFKNVSGECKGNITFNISDINPERKILVINSTTNLNKSQLQSFLGIIVTKYENISHTCFATGNESVYMLIEEAINFTNYLEFYIDEQTSTVWHLPINDEIKHGLYHKANAPGFIKRLENNLTEEFGFASFVNLAELSMVGIPLKNNQITVDYLYFSDKNYIGSPVRGLPEWFRINSQLANKYGLIELME